MTTIRSIFAPGLAITAIPIFAFAALSPAALAADYGPTLASPDSPTKAVNEAGFLQRWVILEPIGHNGLTDSAVQSAVKAEHFPNQFAVLPKDGETVDAAGGKLTWRAVDTKNYNFNLFHFARSLERPTSNVLFWGVTIIEAPAEMKDVRLAIGSNAASVWWVNGVEVIGIYNDRQAVIDDGVSKRITLKQGANVIRCAIINGGGATDFCARFLDAEDKPITSLIVNLAAAP
jgi:hypothetical protein